MAVNATTIQILTWCGIAIAGARNGLQEDMLSQPEGIGHLNDETAKGIQAACQEYSKRPTVGQRFIVNRVQQKRLIALMCWVKDRVRLNEEASFVSTTTRDEFRNEIAAALEREKMRADMKTKGEALNSTNFQVKLESASQWDRWSIELESTLKMTIGAKGIPLSYVIRADDAPDMTPQTTWEEKARLGVHLNGTSFTQDALAVHNLILRNIADNSNAYTYVKSIIRNNNGRRDIRALRARYENTAMQETHVNDAKKTLSLLTYRSERAMTFEKFVAKFQKAIDDLEKHGRGMHNKDIVDMLWVKICNSDLNMYMAALKVQHQRNKRDFTEILQDIASQVPLLSPVNFKPRGISQLDSQGTEEDGACPAHGAITGDGKLYIGSYSYDQWRAIPEHHRAICSARDKNKGGSRQGLSKSIEAEKRKLSELNSEVSLLAEKRSRIISEIGIITPPNSDDATAASDITGGSSHTGGSSNSDHKSSSSAGRAFGGRHEKAKHK